MSEFEKHPLTDHYCIWKSKQLKLHSGTSVFVPNGSGDNIIERVWAIILHLWYGCSLCRVRPKPEEIYCSFCTDFAFQLMFVLVIEAFFACCEVALWSSFCGLWKRRAIPRHHVCSLGIRLGGKAVRSTHWIMPVGKPLGFVINQRNFLETYKSDSVRWARAACAKSTVLRSPEINFPPKHTRELCTYHYITIREKSSGGSVSITYNRRE